ncbi:MAG TPA: BtpA/SgcQ family protein [Bacillota bacterium]
MEKPAFSFGKKPIIGMVHAIPLPGGPLYDPVKGVRGIEDGLRRDLEALQEGGVDAVMFCNENDRPYRLKAGPETIAVMAAVVSKLVSEVSVPFGVDILWDPIAAVAVGKATGASFVREIFTGAYAGDMGLWNTNIGDAARYRMAIDAKDVKLFMNINAEFTDRLDCRSIAAIAKTVAFGSLPDAICVSGPMTGHAVDKSTLAEVKRAVGDVPVIVNTGCNPDNIGEFLEHADAAVVGTYFKHDGVTWNPVETARVKKFMGAVRHARGA